MTHAETSLVISTSLAGALFALVWSIAAGATPIVVGVASVMGLDIIGGAVCNATATTRDWYHRPGQTWVHHLGFVLPHLGYVMVVAWLFRGNGFDVAYAPGPCRVDGSGGRSSMGEGAG